MAPGSFPASTGPGKDDACSLWGEKLSIAPKSLCAQDEPCHLLCLGSLIWAVLPRAYPSQWHQQCQPLGAGPRFASVPLPWPQTVFRAGQGWGGKQTAVGRLDPFLGKHGRGTDATRSLCPGGSWDMQRRWPQHSLGGFTLLWVCFWWLVALRAWVGHG